MLSQIIFGTIFAFISNFFATKKYKEELATAKLEIRRLDESLQKWNLSNSHLNEAKSQMEEKKEMTTKVNLFNQTPNMGNSDLNQMTAWTKHQRDRNGREKWPINNGDKNNRNSKVYETWDLEGNFDYQSTIIINKSSFYIYYTN